MASVTTAPPPVLPLLPPLPPEVLDDGESVSPPSTSPTLPPRPESEPAMQAEGAAPSTTSRPKGTTVRGEVASEAIEAIAAA